MAGFLIVAFASTAVALQVVRERRYPAKASQEAVLYAPDLLTSEFANDLLARLSVHPQPVSVEVIEALAEKGSLTPDLKAWAHEVRLGGADAAHDLDPFKKEEAQELLDFAELYLTYVYTLPARLKERREAHGKDGEPAKAPN